MTDLKAKAELKGRLLIATGLLAFAIGAAQIHVVHFRSQRMNRSMWRDAGPLWCSV